MIINYDEHSTDIVNIKGIEVSLHDLVTCYNQIQIMKKDGTYPKDMELTFKSKMEEF